jgi:hypothetical protein
VKYTLLKHIKVVLNYLVCEEERILCKIEFVLIGRTLDIEYNLSQIMNAIKSKEQQNHTGLKFLPSAATINNRRRHTYVGTTVATSEVEVTSWKQNTAQSQV